MKIDFPVSGSGILMSDVGVRARRVEDLGLDGVVCAEVDSDPLLLLTAAAGHTDQVDLMTGIVVAFARSPMVLAVQGHALQEYSGGRLVLGVGTQVRSHIERRFSMPWSAPAARMAEYIAAMQAIWSSWATGDRLDFRGDFYTHTLTSPMFVPPPNPDPPPKVLLAAVGPRMSATAGAVADGVLLHVLTTPRYLREVILPAVARGRGARAGASAADFEVAGTPYVVTGRTEEEMQRSKDIVRRQVGFYGSTPAYRGVLELHGWSDLADELTRLSRSSEPAKWEKMAALITDDILDEFAVVGEPHAIAGKLVERYGSMLSRIKMNRNGIVDSELAERLALEIQRVAEHPRDRLRSSVERA